MTQFRSINQALRASRKFRNEYEPNGVFKASRHNKYIVVSVYIRNYEGKLFFAAYV